MKYAGKNALIKFWDKIKQYIDKNKPDMSNYVTKTNYATVTTPGIIKLLSDYGVANNVGNNTAAIYKASDSEIEAATHKYHPLVPANIPKLAEKIKTFLNLATKDDLEGIGGNKEKILYDGNESGLSQITLSENYNNFNWIDIYYKNNRGFIYTVTVYIGKDYTLYGQETTNLTYYKKAGTSSLIISAELIDFNLSSNKYIFINNYTCNNISEDLFTNDTIKNYYIIKIIGRN